MRRKDLFRTMLSGAVGVVAAGGLLLALASGARATLMIQVSDGVNPTQTFADNVGPDFDGREGVLAVLTSIGNFALTFNLAQTKPFIGSASEPVLDLTYAATSFGSGGELTIKYTETDFVGDGPTNGMCRIGGVSGGTVEYGCYYDSGNTPFATTSQIASLGPFGSGSFSGSDGAGINPGPLYALTDVLTITHGPGFGRTTTGNANIAVPEPASLLLFGSGLIGLGLVWRRRWRGQLVGQRPARQD